MTQLVLHYGPDAALPGALPSIPGLLSAQRSPGELRLTIVKPDESTRGVLRTLSATSIEELPVSFSDAMVGYLGNRGERGSFLGESMTSGSRGVA